MEPIEIYNIICISLKNWMETQTKAIKTLNLSDDFYIQLFVKKKKIFKN